MATHSGGFTGVNPSSIRYFFCSPHLKRIWGRGLAVRVGGEGGGRRGGGGRRLSWKKREDRSSMAEFMAAGKAWNVIYIMRLTLPTSFQPRFISHSDSDHLHVFPSLKEINSYRGCFLCLSVCLRLSRISSGWFSDRITPQIFPLEGHFSKLNTACKT